MTLLREVTTLLAMTLLWVVTTLLAMTLLWAVTMLVAVTLVVVVTMLVAMTLVAGTPAVPVLVLAGDHAPGLVEDGWSLLPPGRTNNCSLGRLNLIES